MKIKNMDEKFESFEEFIDYISRGGELEFRYKEKNYFIGHIDEGIYIGIIADEESIKIYTTPEEVCEYLIDNKKIKDIVTNVDVIMRLF